MSFGLETCCKIAVGLHMIKFKEEPLEKLSLFFSCALFPGDQFNTSSSIGYSQISMFPDHLYMSVMVQFTILLQASPRWLDDSILNSSLVIYSFRFFLSLFDLSGEVLVYLEISCELLESGTKFSVLRSPSRPKVFLQCRLWIRVPWRLSRTASHLMVQKPETEMMGRD